MRIWERIRTGTRNFLQKIKNDVVYLVAFIGLYLFRRIPLSIGISIGGFLGGVAYYLLVRERKRALAHLAIAFSSEKPLSERKRIAKKSFQNLGKNLVELINFQKIRNEFDSYIIGEGFSYLDQLLARGKGVLVVTGHLGNWELLACYLAHKGYPLNVVAREVYDERLNRLLLQFREQESIRVILRDSPTASRQILQVLKKGELLAMLIDQDTKVKGVMVDFFGRKANTPIGPAVLTRRRSIPVLAAFIHRIADRRHQIILYPEVDVVQTNDFKHDIEINTEKFSKIIENHIKEYPEDWVWMHRRWRRRTAYMQPPGEG